VKTGGWLAQVVRRCFKHHYLVSDTQLLMPRGSGKNSAVPHVPAGNGATLAVYAKAAQSAQPMDAGAILIDKNLPKPEILHPWFSVQGVGETW
jgi:hypothetical protein